MWHLPYSSVLPYLWNSFSWDGGKLAFISKIVWSIIYDAANKPFVRQDEYLSWDLSAKQRRACAGTHLIGMLFMLTVMGWRWGRSVCATEKQSDGTGRGEDWKLIKPALALAPSLNHGPRTVTQVLRSPGGHYWGVSIAMVTWWCSKWEWGGDEDFVFMCQDGAKERGLWCASWHDNFFPAKAPLLWAAAATFFQRELKTWMASQTWLDSPPYRKLFAEANRWKWNQQQYACR